jgi:hypothetical protein
MMIVLKIKDNKPRLDTREHNRLFHKSILRSENPQTKRGWETSINDS